MNATFALPRLAAAALLAALGGVVPGRSQAQACHYPEAVRADFAERDLRPQFLHAGSGSWGPAAAPYPPPAVPAMCQRVEWQRQRVLEVARKYIGLPYRHHHVPGFDAGDGPGLDCSNFTAWVYNYGLGVRLDSAIERQSLTAGRQLAAGEPLRPGDLLFIRTMDDRRISHVALYVDPTHVIDDHGSGVAVRDFKGWYKAHLAFARRVIE